MSSQPLRVTSGWTHSRQNVHNTTVKMQMLVNVLSWRRVHYWHPFVNVFKDNRWTWKMYVCIYVQQYAYACVWNVGLMYVHVYVTAPQSKWSSPHFIWWHHRANEGSLFMPSSHLRLWLHRANGNSLFMPLPYFIWWHQSKWRCIVHAIISLHMMAPQSKWRFIVHAIATLQALLSGTLPPNS